VQAPCLLCPLYNGALTVLLAESCKTGPPPRGVSSQGHSERPRRDTVYTDPLTSTSASPRLLISCGEPSGDLYAAELVRQLKARFPDLVSFGLGGERLAGQGTRLFAHIGDLAVVGILEVLRHVPRIRAVFRQVVDALDRERPDAAVLIDYPDFNLRLAAQLKKRGVPVLYYVSPQVWAWKRGRIRTIRETVSRMLVIFPFEEALYRAEGIPVTHVGHPLVDLVKPSSARGAFLADLGLDPRRPVVALLPGSRRPELTNNLPPLLDSVKRIAAVRPDAQFLLAVAPLLDAAAIESRCAGLPIRCVRGQSHAVLGAADLALVASGTVTVETALLGTPMVVVYRVAPLTYALGRPFISVPHFAMVNLIAERRVVPELMQADFTAERVTAEALSLLSDAGRAQRMREDLADVVRRLGGPGATARVASIVGDVLADRARP
jgi:lipid-A-disaccharide synthase